MKVICVDDSDFEGVIQNEPGLTFGKTYDAVYDTRPYREIGIDAGFSIRLLINSDDNGAENYYYKRRFKLLDDIREEKLNDILDGI